MSEKFDSKNIVWEDEDSDLEMEDVKKSLTDEHSEFATLLDQSSSQSTNYQRPQVGKKISGTVLSASSGSNDILIDLGGKNIGILTREELRRDDSNKYDDLKVGDTVEAIVIDRKGSEFYLSTSLSASLKSEADLKAAFQNRIPVKAKVVKENKGGFDVSILGHSAFCPISQIDLKSVTDKSEYLNKDFDFIITQYSSPRDIVVSRKEALRAQSYVKFQQFEEILHKDPFAEFDGKVTEIRDFGAFVDMDGIEGMIHISELGWSRVSSVSDALQVGDSVRVKVLKVDTDSKTGRPKISLSMKAVSQDPWETISDKIQAGKSYTAKVVRLEKFGAFMELLPGIDGLLHISEISSDKNIRFPSEVLKVGDELSVIVSSIEPNQRRIKLSTKDPTSSVSSVKNEDKETPKEWVDKSSSKNMGSLGMLLKQQLDAQNKK